MSSLLKGLIIFFILSIILIILSSSSNLHASGQDVIVQKAKSDINENQIREQIIKNISVKYDYEIDKIKVYEVLNSTDTDTLKYIKSVEVLDVYDFNCDGLMAVGCTRGTLRGYDDEHMYFSYATIHVVSTKYYGFNGLAGFRCSSFEATLNHEIGHVKGLMISRELYESEDFAENYSLAHTTAKDVC